MNLFYKFTFWNDSGTIKETIPIQAKSFLKPFVWALNAALAQTVASSAMLDIYGSPLLINTMTPTLMADHAGGDTVNQSIRGIVVGTGTNAVTVDDYKLQTQILHGITTGKLEYLSCAATNLVVTGATYSFDLERVFKNSSGGAIAVSEIGIYAYCWYYAYPSTYSYFAMVRDIVSPAESIADGTYMKITYTFQIT